MGVRTLCIVFLLLIFAPQAHAACSDPNGDEGDIVYNGDHNVVQFCTGAVWIAMGGGGGSGGTTTIGTLQADKWCQADNTGSVINCEADAPSGGGGGKFVDGTDPNEAVYTTGNVGVGTGMTDPADPLHVASAVRVTGSTPLLRLGNTAAASASQGWQIQNNGGLYFGTTEDDFSAWQNSAVLFLDRTGKIGLGTASPNALLHVSGNGTVQIDGSTPTYHSLFNYSTNRDVYIRAGTAAGKIVIGDQNTGKVELTGPGDKVISGNVGIGTATPAQKLDVVGTVKATNLESRGSAIVIRLNSCGGACGSYHAVGSWVNTGVYSITWATVLNTNPALYSHANNGHIIVDKSGLYRITQRPMVYGPAFSHLYTCPYVNGVLACGGMSDTPYHFYAPSGYWANNPMTTILELPAGADVTFGYLIPAAVTYWAHDSYTQMWIERLN